MDKKVEDLTYVRLVPEKEEINRGGEPLQERRMKGRGGWNRSKR